MKAVPKHCIACDRPLKGRVDKKFCDDYCRNNYNNRLNSDATPLIRTINNALRRNRRIIVTLMAGNDKPTTVPEKQLQEEGFNFQYFTHTYTNNKDEVYFFCYDFGYRLVENNKCMLVKERKELQTGKTISRRESLKDEAV